MSGIMVGLFVSLAMICAGMTVFFGVITTRAKHRSTMWIALCASVTFAGGVIFCLMMTLSFILIPR